MSNKWGLQWDSEGWVVWKVISKADPEKITGTNQVGLGDREFYR